jgi:uncharacterized protein YqgC (DUF456 family)
VTPLGIAGLAAFIIFLFLGTFSVVFGFPGTVVIIIDVIIYAWVTGFEVIGVKLISALLLITVCAESLDFLMGTARSKRFGSSGKGLIAAVMGGILGAVLFTPVLMGLGMIAGMFIGGFTGALIVEWYDEMQLKPGFRTGGRILFMRALCIVLKGFLAIVMTVTALSAIYS